MSVLWDDENKEVTEEDLHLVHTYYANLYSQPTVSLTEAREQVRTLTLIDKGVSKEDNTRLEELLNAEELRDTINDLPSDKLPREDSLPVEVL
ncbi:hypothetical protein R1flu_014471 [Riccia fluitans]|uniref:Uncharacterized protein n=1 Tax=Riccia fluitans TaxID=41844 RepID=A0ABD1YGX3_9MARC